MTMKLTQEERELILKKRKEDKTKRKNEEKYSKPFRVGILKHDLYNSQLFDDFDSNVVTKQEILDSLEVLVTKGTVVESYLQQDEEDVEMWFDDSGYIEYRDNDWAEENLTKIKSCR